MSALDVFQYAGQPVRTVIIDGEPWFVAADVAAILGYRMASDLTRSLDADEKGTHETRTPSGDQMVSVVNEGGLYKALVQRQTGRMANEHMRAQVKAFQRWVTREVLPAIRRTGAYGSALPQNFAEALELAAAEVRRAEALEAKVAADAPKVAAYDALMDAEGFYTMEAVAKLGGIGRTTLFRRLREAGVIQSGSRLPYQRYAHWFKITTSTWTDGEGVAHVSNTARVLPDALAKVLGKAGVQLEAVAR